MLTFPSTRFKPVAVTPHPVFPEGVQVTYEFPNGYSVSVIQNEYSYGGTSGLWEMAVLLGGDFVPLAGWQDDVMGFLTDYEIDSYLVEVSEIL